MTNYISKGNHRNKCFSSESATTSAMILDAPINDNLMNLGVTDFKKQGQITILILCKGIAVIFPISKDGPYNTLINFENAAKGKLDKVTIEATKVALLQNNVYLKFLLYGDGKVNGGGDDYSHANMTGEGQEPDDTGGPNDISQPLPNDNDSSNQEEKTAAQKALELVGQQCSALFLDQFGSPYAAAKIGEHVETLPLKSSRFKNWLCKIFYESENNVLNSENLTNVLNVLKAKAEFGGNTKTLHLRIANLPEEPYIIYYDLTNKDWQTVKIIENSWCIEYAHTIFRRYNNQQSQVYPSRGYPQDIFDKFMQLINVKNEDSKLLLKCYIISLFIPDIPKPVLMLHGEQGSAKSTLQELIKMLVDPSSIRILTFPRDINELVQKLMHNYICYFDNVSIIPEWISDQLCRAVTGSGFSKRELYSDDDDIIYSFKRCIGFNGINLGATKADLLDRGIIVKLERILKEDQQKLEVIWQEFEKIKSQLLGYIFDILIKVLQVKKEGGIEINGYPRMADFAEIAEIVSRSMGYADYQFLEAYYNNIKLQVEEALEANPVATALVKFREDNRQKWKGTATELLAELDQIAEKLRINTHDKLWPKSPNWLSRRVTEVKTNLREKGIVIDSYNDPKANIKIIEIRNISLEPLESLEDKNQAQTQPTNLCPKNHFAI
jgi:hypothetical protein